MARVVSIGRQDFGKMRVNNNFYVDKTYFIREWWEADDDVTLITRPRRFGKTLTMSMVEQFFSRDYAGQGKLFDGLSIWEDAKYQKLQGKYPVIGLSFSTAKGRTYRSARRLICDAIRDLYARKRILLEEGFLNQEERRFFEAVTMDMEEDMAIVSLQRLSGYLSRYYGEKVIILLDEYDTPMQEAYFHGYWDEMAELIRSMFNATFKTNPYMARAILTGITRVSKESIFSDLNNLKVVTVTSEEYADCFGFTEDEVFRALEEYGMGDRKDEVREWYDGFQIGSVSGIYNPWSILNLLDTKKFGLYWVNTSSNSLVGKLIQEGDVKVKIQMETLLRGGSIRTPLDEQIVFSHLNQEEGAIWSLLLASGYLKAVSFEVAGDVGYDEDPKYELVPTNGEVRRMFRAMVKRWFAGGCSGASNAFQEALLLGDVKKMNKYMNEVALRTFSYFDVGKKPSEEEPERFYHGFVLGLMVELASRYTLTSNRESGFGRYDVMLEPKNEVDDGIIIEFKVQDPEEEADLSDTVAAALRQIEEKQYETALRNKGIPAGRIRKYGFAFRGKEVLIGEGDGNCSEKNALQ